MVAPAVYPLVAVLAGTLLGWYCSEGKHLFLVCLTLSVTGALTFWGLRRKSAWKGAPLLICILFAAAARTSFRLNPELPPCHIFQHAGEKPVLLEGTVYGQPMPATGYTLIPLEAHRLRTSRDSKRVQGRIDLLLSGTPTEDLRIGEVLLTEARLHVVRNRGNPGEFDRQRRSFLSGIYVRGSIRDPGRIFGLGMAPGYGFWRWVQDLRERVSHFLESVPHLEERSLLKAWLIGDRAEIPAGVNQVLTRSGLAHINAISGLQVALVAVLVHAGLRVFLSPFGPILVRGWRDKIAALIGLPFVVLYVLLAGSPVTAVRAGIMAVLVSCSLLLDRVNAVWNGLALAGVGIVLWDPSALFSVSFLLSFAAIAALLAAVPRWNFQPRRQRFQVQEVASTTFWKKVEKIVWQLAVVTLAASAATAPLTAYFFNRVTPFAVLPNLLVVPLVCWVVIPAGLGAVLLSVVSPVLALPLLSLASLATRVSVMIATLFSRMPGSSLVTGTPSLLELILCYLVLLLLFTPRVSVWKRKISSGLAAALFLLILAGVLRQRLSTSLEVTYLSVGNGDAALVVFPGGRRMVVDGGPAIEGRYDSGAKILAPCLGHHRICRVDYLVISHGQVDHYGGLQFIAENYRPRELWIGPETGSEEGGYPEFLKRCEERKIRIRRLCRQTPPLVLNGVRIEVSNPPCGSETDFQELRAAGVQGVNNASLVIRIVYGSVSFLFTGDLGKPGERMLLQKGSVPPATVLKVAHHGSAGSSSVEFLDRVYPRLAVVSVGAGNRFGFPAQALLRLLGARGTPVYRTDLDGAVRVRTDGRTVQVHSFGSGREENWREPELAPAGGHGSPEGSPESGGGSVQE